MIAMLLPLKTMQRLGVFDALLSRLAERSKPYTLGDGCSVEYRNIFHQVHRSGRPASIRCDPGGRPFIEEWLRLGKYHREEGPAVTYLNVGSDTIKSAEWHKDGLRHREDGPSEIIFNDDGTFRREAFFWDNVSLTDEMCLARWLAKTSDIAPDNIAAAQRLMPFIERDKQTRGFIRPSDDDIAIALELCPNGFQVESL